MYACLKIETFALCGEAVNCTFSGIGVGIF